MFKFITSTFLIVLSGTLFGVFIDPTYQEIKDLRSDTSQYDEALYKSKELRIIRDSLLSRYNSFDQEKVARLGKAVPDNVNNVRLIMEIDSIASKFGAVLRNVAVNLNSEDEKLGRNTEDYGESNVDLLVETSYENFLRFLDDLSKSLRIIDISNLSFSSTNLDVYRFKLTFKTYWLK